MRDKIINLVILFFLISAVISAFPLGKQILEKNNNAELMASLESPTSTTDKQEAEIINITPSQKYKLLYEQNPDFFGWISIPDTNINYPVMKSIEHNFYLNHNFKKDPSKYGTPFVDENYDINNYSNLIIYGHHMKDGTMFADLNKYMNKSYYEKHPIIHLDTLTQSHDFEIVGVLTIPAIDAETEFYKTLTYAKPENYSNLNSYISNRKLYDTNSVLLDEHILTLITCEYTQKDGRLLVIAKEKSIIN